MPRTYDDDLKTMLALGYEAIGVLFLIAILNRKLGSPVTTERLAEFGCPSERTLKPLISKIIGLGYIERVSTNSGIGFIVPEAKQLILGQIYGVSPDLELPAYPVSLNSAQPGLFRTVSDPFTYEESASHAQNVIQNDDPLQNLQAPPSLASSSSLTDSFEKELKATTSSSDSRLAPLQNLQPASPAEAAQNRAMLNALGVTDKKAVEQIAVLPHINPRYIAAAYAEYDDEREGLRKMPEKQRGKRFLTIGALLWRLKNPDRYEPKTFPPRHRVELDSLISWAQDHRVRDHDDWVTDDDDETEDKENV